MLDAPAAHPRYRLAPHVRACRIDEQVVLLDLRRNKYIGVGGPQLALLSREVADWPASASSQKAAEPVQELGLATLVEQCLLVPASQPGPTPIAIERPSTSLTLEAEAPASTTAARRLARLCWSAVVASHWLQRHRLADIATRVARLRRPQQHEESARNADLGKASAAYLRLRPFVLTAHDRCLHDSLTLIRYLAGEGLFPSWVIGVRTRPFGAHSWVQSGGLVLNDLHENVRAFTPILVV